MSNPTSEGYAGSRASSSHLGRHSPGCRSLAGTAEEGRIDLGRIDRRFGPGRNARRTCG